MRLTNTSNLPETIVRALHRTNERYNAGEVDSSVTQLIQPPRINILRKKHYADMTRDVADEFWALLGSGVHYMLEQGATANMIVEERLYMNIDGWRISGAIDVQEVDGNFVDITDYKVTSTYSVLKRGEPKREWVEQLNLQAMLVEANKPLRVRSLSICAVLRDWSSADAKRDPMYPQAPVVVVPLPLWTKDQQLDYARERVEAHRRAAFDDEMGNTLDECTPADRWVKGDKWAVTKKGGKRAVKIFDNPGDAITLANTNKEYEIVLRPGKSTRCGYCGVKFWCDQYQSSIKPVEGEEEE